MGDLLNDMRMRARYDARPQAAFVRFSKALGVQPDNISSFNIRTLLRIRDLNPLVYACAMSLLNSEVGDDPATIRESKIFANLVDRLGLQSSSPTKASKNSHKASLVLLEVFSYMVAIHAARTSEEEVKTAIQEEGELTR